MNHEMDRYSVCLTERNQGKWTVFTLMIFKIAIKKMKILAASKTCDRSELCFYDVCCLRQLHQTGALAEYFISIFNTTPIFS
jgi:hypothetical protein